MYGDKVYDVKRFDWIIYDERYGINFDLMFPDSKVRLFTIGRSKGRAANDDYDCDIP